MRSPAAASTPITAAILAAFTCFLIKPDSEYIGYFDFKTLTCLFCTLAVICALKNLHFFTILARKIVRCAGNTRSAVFALVCITFIGSMLIANDMALLTFLPLGYFVLSTTNKKRYMAFTFIMQNIAANLGGMVTPFGNPQNLFLYANYELSAGDFFGTVVPIAAVSFVCLLICGLTRKSEAVTVNFTEKVELAHPKLCLMFAALFVLTLLSVFHVVHYAVVTVIVAILLFFFSKDLLGEVDYMLLITFVCFFVFLKKRPFVFESISLGS